MPDAASEPARPTRRVLVTGASSGIGRALALAFARRGDALIVHGRDEERLREAADAASAAAVDAAGTATDAGNAPPEPLLVTADLAEPGGTDAVLDAARADGPIDVLVNNAGFGTSGPFHAPDADRDEALVAVNVVAATRLAKALLPHMVDRGRGGILNVASTASFQPGPHAAAYYASKAYLLHLSEAISVETRDTGVTVTALCPGPTRSGFHDNAAMNEIRLLRTPGLFLDADRVAEAGVRAFERGRRVVVPGLVHALGAFLLPRLPRGFTLAFLRYANTPPG